MNAKLDATQAPDYRDFASATIQPFLYARYVPDLVLIQHAWLREFIGLSMGETAGLNER